MAASSREDCGLESQSSSIECMPSSQHCPSSDSLPEWRSSEQVENGTPSTSPPYWDTDEDDDPGPRPSDLFGKYTWKIDDFSQINKRELRSNIFEIGGYKWYILIYPQGCDVCNHLSLFLCVANHDKLLPGWSHFAQFTIAVVNKDSKKSKYSDTLHRFWKKEHDWGWKKFMELSKVSDGFLVDDALVIKAQVQVIREKTDRPFRCLDWQYRRELVRVYLSNVEQLCRRFVEEKRGKFSKMLDDKVRWSSFHAFWLGVDQNARRRMSRDKLETILKVVVKHFFIENEVTSTLVMDYLYNGLKVLECQSKSKKGGAKLLEMEEMPVPFVHVEKDIFVLTDDVLLLLQRAASEPLPPKDEKSSQNQNRMKEGNCGEELSKDSIERDERRLTELGRRTVEIFALNHIFSSRIEVAYQEAVALRRQEELIREEEAAGQAENEMKTKRSAAEKEKRTKKKQTKQKKGSRKGKDRGRDEKHDTTLQKVQVENNSRERVLEEFKENSVLSVCEQAKTSADVSDMSDIGEEVAETLQLVLEERDTSPISWDTDASEIHPPVNAEPQKGQVDKKAPSVMDDSSSTCSTDSVPSIVMNGPTRVNTSSNIKNLSSRSRGKNRRGRCTNDQSDPAQNDTDKLQADSSIIDTTHLCDVTGSCRGTASESEAVGFSPNDHMQQIERHPLKEEVVSLKKKPSNNGQVDMHGPFKSVTAEQSSSISPTKSPSICQQSKQTSERSIIAADPVLSSNSRCQTENLVPTITRSPLISKQEAKSTVDSKVNMAHQPSVESRPSSAPLVPAMRLATPLTSPAPSVPLLSRSVSAAGRLGVDPSPSTQNNVLQSYRNAIMAGKATVGTNAPSFAPRTSSYSSTQTSAFSSSSPTIISSASALPLQKSAMGESNSGRPGLTFGSVNPEALQSQCLWTQELLQGDAASSVVSNHNPVCDDVRPYFTGSSHQTYRLDEVSSGLSVHHMQGLGPTQDEFPHLDIINDLLNEEQCNGEVAANGYYRHSHDILNQQYTFADDASTAAVDVMSNESYHFDQLDHYYEDKIQRVYGCSGGPLDGRRGLTSTPLDLSAYMNGQLGGVFHNQWPLGISDHSVLSLGGPEANGYAFHLQDYSDLACGLNGYNVYRPANGH